MGESLVLSALIAGLFSSNIVVSSGIGFELGTNNLTGAKNASVYSLIVGVCSVFSSIVLFVLNLILKSFEVESYFIVAALLVVAVFVQIAEYLAKKFMPLFFTQTKYFVPSLVSSLFIVLVCAFSQASNFLHLLLITMAESLGVFMVLVLVASIRKNNSSIQKKPILNGNVLSLVILLFVMMAFTAF